MTENCKLKRVECSTKQKQSFIYFLFFFQLPFGNQKLKQSWNSLIIKKNYLYKKVREKQIGNKNNVYKKTGQKINAYGVWLLIRFGQPLKIIYQ